MVINLDVLKKQASVADPLESALGFDPGVSL
jgi:hypothetical protein